MLRALNGHYGSFSDEEMLQICAEVGSDVSFCYYGKTALCEGRGEILTPIAFERKLFFVIAIGNGRISTPKAYGALDEKFSDFDGSVEPCGYDNAPKLFYGADNKEAVEIYNIFEEIFRDEAVGVFDLKALLTEFGAKYTLMTGSGPAVFGIFDTPSEALAASKKIISLGFDAFYAESVF
jgi:4-diphosphocytidyl-2-C-methyl-D-erythritol kinase